MKTVVERQGALYSFGYTLSDSHVYVNGSTLDPKTFDVEPGEVTVSDSGLDAIADAIHRAMRDCLPDREIACAALVAAFGGRG